MRVLLITLTALTIMISCGDREEREKEVVYNDPRFQNTPCECKCLPNECGQCPSRCTVTVYNTNTNDNNCNKKEDPAVCPVCPKQETPVIIVQQQQNQDQEQSTQSQNDNNSYSDSDSTNTNTNDNGREFVLKMMINKRWYNCYKPCNSQSCWGSSPQTTMPMDYMRIIEGNDGQPLECLRVPGQM